MIKSRKLWISSALLASSLLAINLASHAGTGDHGDGKCDKDKKHAAFGGHKGFSDSRFLQHKLRQLDLNAEQQAQVKQIMEQQKPMFDEKRQAAHDGFKALAAVSGSQYDEKKVLQLAGEHAKAQADLMVLRAQTLQEVYKVLTPEQQQKWAEFQSRVKPKHDEKA